MTAPRVVMLGDALWRRTFASDPRVVGTVVTISSQRYEVIGVAPPTFTGPRGWLASAQFWLRSAPNQTGGAEAGDRPLASNSDDRRGVVGGADDRRASTSRFHRGTEEEPHRHGSAMAGKDDGRDRGRGHGRAAGSG